MNFSSLYYKILIYGTLIGALIVAYMLLLKVTGHSPTLEQATFTLVIMLMGWQLQSTISSSKFKGEMLEFKRNTISSFNAVRNDMAEFKEETRNSFFEVKQDIKEIRTDISTMKTDIALIKHALKIH